MDGERKRCENINSGWGGGGAIVGKAAFLTRTGLIRIRIHPKISMRIRIPDLSLAKLADFKAVPIGLLSVLEIVCICGSRAQIDADPTGSGSETLGVSYSYFITPLGNSLLV